MKIVSAQERGAALLTILLLVAVMAVIAATALDRLTLATRIVGSAASTDQARAFVMAAEQIALRRITGMLGQGTGGNRAINAALGRPIALPLPSGQAVVRLNDAENCFNLNALVAETSPNVLSQRPQVRAQFAELMKLAGVDENRTGAIVGATGDWIDSDSIEGPLGAEDAVYRAMSPSYLPANRRMVDISEWRTVRGVTPDIYARMKPWLCILPTSALPTINVNSLAPEQAPLVAMLLPGQLPLARVRAVLAGRPAGGYGSGAAFWRDTALGGVDPPPDIAKQVVVASRWLMLTTMVRLGDEQVTARTLIDATGDADAAPALPRLAGRRWGEGV